MKEFDGPISFSEPAGIIFQADMDMMKAQEAQDLQAIKDKAERHARRMAQYADWIKPENIAARKKKAEEEAEAAWERGRQMAAEFGEWVYPEPLPDPLPKHCQGQCESTIRKLLSHKKIFKEPTGFVLDKKASTFNVKPK